MSTATTTLTRVKFEPNLDYKPSAMTLDLAERAQRRLGYSALSMRIRDASAKVNSEAQVLAAFTKVGCDPLDPKKVEAYKEERLKVLNKGKDPNRESVYHWDSLELRYYHQPVPEFALSRALELSEALPGASFYVEHTTDAHPDPFMVMYYQGMKFYVDVWDEPSFEGRRVV